MMTLIVISNDKTIIDNDSNDHTHNDMHTHYNSRCRLTSPTGHAKGTHTWRRLTAEHNNSSI